MFALSYQDKSLESLTITKVNKKLMTYILAVIN